MHFKLWLENDEIEHGKALRTTGFWGKQGAGSIVLAKSTGRILLPLRSARVEQPLTWGTWGGAIDSKENPSDAAKRELQEEAGYHGSIEMVPLSVFQKGTFKYFNFLAIVSDEFKPSLNWETQSYTWTDIDNLPEPLHFGLEWVLDRDHNKIKSQIERYNSELIFK